MKNLFLIFLFSIFYFLFPINPVLASSDSLYFLHTDHLNSTVLITDSSGNPVSSPRYLPYGSSQLPTSSFQLLTSRLYTGQEKDTETGLYYYKARYYNPTTGRFISADRGGSGLNKYSYAANNPVNFMDNGNDPIPPETRLAELFCNCSASDLSPENFKPWVESGQRAINLATKIRQSIVSGDIDPISINRRIISEAELGEITTMRKQIGWSWSPELGNEYDFRSINRAKLKNLDIALAVAIAGQESSFDRPPYTLGRNMNPDVGTRLMLTELNFRARELSKQGIQFDIRSAGKNIYADPAQNFLAFIYAYRSRLGFTPEALEGSGTKFSLIDEYGNLSKKYVSLYVGENGFTDFWSQNVNFFYNALKTLSNEYPNEYGWLTSDVLYAPVRRPAGRGVVE